MMHTVSKHRKYIDFTILFFLSLAILNTILCIISRTYEEFVNFIFANSYKPYAETLLPNKNVELFYTFFKILLFFVVAWLGSVWIDFYTNQKKQTTKFLIRISNSLYYTLKNNKKFLSNLKKETLIYFIVFFSILTVTFFIFLIRVPISYDELLSYRSFSSIGIWTSLSFYPIPNNHVFYNIVSSIFITLPLDDEISIRLPAFIASLLTVYYFFKLCYYQFGSIISFIITIFIVTLYPFIIYSITARGYAFVNLFCVLIIYSSVKLMENPFSKKYRYLFIFSGFLGMLSVPSFIYLLFPVYFTILIYVLREKNSKRLILFLKDCLITGLLIIIAYSFILCLNNPTNLINPNGGATKFSMKRIDAFFIIKDHLKDVSYYLFSYNKVTFFVNLILLGILFPNLFLNKKNNRLFLIILSFSILISPLVILCLHQVIPFNRIWIYLIFPFGIGVGFIFQYLSGYIKRLKNIEKLSLGKNIPLFSIVMMIFSFIHFENKHQLVYLDYEIKNLREQYLNAELRNIQSVAQTQNGLEFYPAEIICNLCYKLDRRRNVRLSPLDSVTNQDILIIDQSRIEHFKPQLSNYHLLHQFRDGFSIFHKNK